MRTATSPPASIRRTPTGTQARYEVLEGEVVSEKRSGVRKLYVPDPLGSTRCLIDPTQTQTDTFSFFPYGEIQSRTGTTPAPFQSVGTLGYHLDLSGLVYVRARSLDVARGRWMTRDPVGRDSGTPPYEYSASGPTGVADPSGRQPPPPDLSKLLQECLKKCKGKQFKAWATCMLQCLGDQAWKYCPYVWCLAFPESYAACKWGCDPCKNCPQEEALCDCCDLQYQCCILRARSRLALKKCNDDRTNCYCQNDCIKG